MDLMNYDPKTQMFFQEYTFTYRSANTVCRHLGLPLPGRVLPRGQFGPGLSRIWLNGVNCRGTEARLDDCAWGVWGNAPWDLAFSYPDGRWYEGTFTCTRHDAVAIECGSAPPGELLARRTVLALCVHMPSEMLHAACPRGIVAWQPKCSLSCSPRGCLQSGCGLLTAFRGSRAGWRSYSTACGARCGLCCVVLCVMRCCRALACICLPPRAGYGCLTICSLQHACPICCDHPQICERSGLSRFTHIAATIACKQMGLKGPGRVVDGVRCFGAGKGPVWLKQLECTGSEARLEHCAHDGWGRILELGYYDLCNGHSSDVGIVCDAPQPPTQMCG